MTTLSDVTCPAPARSPGLGRAAAVLAFGSAVVHLLLVDTDDLGSLAMLAMALVCLPCAWHLWRSPTAGVWGLTATADTTMLALHAQMLSTSTGGPTHAVAAAHLAHGTAHGPGALMWLGLGLVATQLGLAGLAAVRR